MEANFVGPYPSIEQCTTGSEDVLAPEGQFYVCTKFFNGGLI